MVIKLQRHADDVVTLSLEKPGDHGRIDATRHRHDDAGPFRTTGKVKTVEHIPTADAGLHARPSGHLPG
jgi:hypothetical protein